MKVSNNKYFSKLAIVAILALFIIFILMFANYFLKIKNHNEGFTSGFRQMYRPHIRNARLVVENYYNKSKNNFHLILKKIGVV
jgi:hypothetical protein